MRSKIFSILLPFLFLAGAAQAQTAADIERLDRAIAALERRCTTSLCQQNVADAKRYRKEGVEYCSKAEADMPGFEREAAALKAHNMPSAELVGRLLAAYKIQAERLCGANGAATMKEIVYMLENVKN